MAGYTMRHMGHPKGGHTKDSQGLAQGQDTQ